MPKLRHYDGCGTARFVTFNCYRNEACFRNPEACRLLLKHVKEVREKHHFKLISYVIMPDHVHLVLWPPDGMKLGLVVGEIKSKFARDYFSTIATGIPEPRVFWEKRCYDHNCRSSQTTCEKINYCHNNPVRRKLVESPEDYIWSSFNWYQGKENVPLQLDEVQLV